VTPSLLLLPGEREHVLRVGRRQGGVGFRVFAGTMLGLSFFLTGRLFSNLGVLNDWPALFSATFPLVVFIAMTVSMLWWLERR